MSGFFWENLRFYEMLIDSYSVTFNAFVYQVDCTVWIVDFSVFPDFSVATATRVLFCR
jgi:hypothetical protein